MRLLFRNPQSYYAGLGSIPQNPLKHHLENEMVITSAHISPIMALVAGILILIMPRLLNFIVAIYLILFGLIGLGLLHWLHM